MEIVELTYGDECYKEIRKFLNDNYNKDYTLSIFDMLGQTLIEVIADFDSMIDVVAYVINTEHDFPAWIGVNELSDSYVVGMNFTRGNLETSAVYEWKDGKLVMR